MATNKGNFDTLPPPPEPLPTPPPPRRRPEQEPKPLPRLTVPRPPAAPPAPLPPVPAEPKPFAPAVKPTAVACGPEELSDEAKALLGENANFLSCVQLLIDGALFHDAVALLAHALPKRDAVRWACQCVRSAAGTGPAPAVKAALQAAEAWAADPSDANRRAAYDVAEKAGFGTPAGCAALGAYMSGGSLGPADLPAVPPHPLLTARMAANAVVLAGIASEPARAPERYAAFLAQGVQLCSGPDHQAAK